MSRSQMTAKPTRLADRVFSRCRATVARSGGRVYIINGFLLVSIHHRNVVKGIIQTPRHASLLSVSSLCVSGSDFEHALRDSL